MSRSTFTITRYTAAHKQLWNDVIKKSVNGTFLFYRDFMEYHADRFEDHSIIIADDDQIVAVVPGNETGRAWSSHQGLTYGVPVVINAMVNLADICQTLFDYLKTHFEQITFNLQPFFYNTILEELVFLFEKEQFKITRVLQNYHVDFALIPVISKKKTAGYRNGKYDSLILEKNASLETFWNTILKPQLQNRHHTVPVHSLEEIQLLASKFPNEIKQYAVYENDTMLAGVTYFFKNSIAKSQYAVASPEGMQKRALDFLYIECMQDFKDAGYAYLDFGPVNDLDNTVNEGVARFKKELGGLQSNILRYEWRLL